MWLTRYAHYSDYICKDKVYKGLPYGRQPNLVHKGQVSQKDGSPLKTQSQYAYQVRLYQNLYICQISMPHRLL